MRHEHFEALRPICPACLLSRGKNSLLRLGTIAVEQDGDIREGSLICSDLSCQREHPILDGIPVVLADAPSWLKNQILGVLRREDLSDFTESLLGDLSGSQSAFDSERGNLSIYADSHWSPEAPGYLTLFEAVTELLDKASSGRWLDLGCSLGRGTVELARRHGRLTVGVDLNFSMLRLAEQIRRTGEVRYRRRRVGLVFDTVTQKLDDMPGEHVSYWCADAAALPFADDCFDGALALNMLDCVASPVGLIQELARLTRESSDVLLATPFDWAAAATQPAAWVGGHSQRSAPGDGSSLDMFRYLLNSLPLGFVIMAERDPVTWRLRLHERSVTEYQVYCARLNRCAPLHKRGRPAG